jgi:hypothetical protein
MANDTFPPSLAELVDGEYSWSQAANPQSALGSLLTAIATEIDELGDQIDLIWQSRSILTAQPADLIAQYGYVWGLLSEQLPSTQAVLAQYILACAADDGSINSATRILTELVLAGDNMDGGPVLTFDPGGAGLTFPSNGAGLQTWQFGVGDTPEPLTSFPAGGGGLVFAADGTGILLTNNPYVAIAQDVTTWTWVVTVASWVAYDAPTFARAVEKLRPAHFYAAEIRSSTQPPPLLQYTRLFSAITATLAEATITDVT